MNVLHKQLVRFHLTGEVDVEQDEEHGLRPALLAPYRNLAALRYDYPLVLTRNDVEDTCVRSLSSIVDGVLQTIAPTGVDGEQMRKHCLRLETRIRVLVSGLVAGSLTEFWDTAELELVAECDEDETQSLTEDLQQARRALSVNGEIVDCDEHVTAKLFEHVWTQVQQARNRQALARLDQLAFKLAQILEADFHQTDSARTPDSIRGSMGASFDDTFDFAVMADILEKGSPESSLTDHRRQRIRTALTTLQSQRFFAREGGTGSEATDDAAHAVVFPTCTVARQAFQEQIAEKIELLKAIAIAELEIDNRYDEADHDGLLAGFSERSLTQEDLDFFPSYLIVMHIADCQGEEKAILIDTLSSGLPMKVLVETNDILTESSLGRGRLSFGVQSQQLATMAVGLNDAFVLQSTSSNLHQVRDRIHRGLTCEGPALFSIFAGSADDVTDLPRYLSAACAMQSRAFPTFTYDPTRGPNLAARFDVSDNPQHAVDWPLQRLSYEDEDLQRISEDVTITFIDFAACDKRYASSFVTVPKDAWSENLLSPREYAEIPVDEIREQVPCVLMVDDDDVLHKRVVDDRLIRAARRCLEMWHNLQELGGINNSHALKLLAQERCLWEQEKERALNELKSQTAAGHLVEPGQPVPVVSQQVDSAPAVAQAAAEPEPASAEAAEPESEQSTDEPFIETPRCTTCDECTDMNNKLFIYDENKQAYIADLAAGTFRELVEAAEVCQVAIIHPGKPHDSNEPGLSDLIQRADEFN